MNGKHVTAHFAGFYLGWLGAEPAPSVNLIRSWAHRGKVRRVGTDEWGFALYDLDQIMAHARYRGLFDNIDVAPGEDACNRTTDV